MYWSHISLLNSSRRPCPCLHSPHHRCRVDGTVSLFSLGFPFGRGPRHWSWMIRHKWTLAKVIGSTNHNIAEIVKPRYTAVLVCSTRHWLNSVLLASSTLLKSVFDRGVPTHLARASTSCSVLRHDPGADSIYIRANVNGEDVAQIAWLNTKIGYSPGFRLNGKN